MNSIFNWATACASSSFLSCSRAFAARLTAVANLDDASWRLLSDEQAVKRESAGASRIGRHMAVAFDRALRHASRRGDLRIERLPRFSDPSSRKLSTPEQPEVDLRTVGDGRQLADVPADELAALALRVYDRTPTLTREELVRQVLSLCGWSRLGATVRDILERAIPPELGAEHHAVGTDDQIAAAAERYGVSGELKQVLEVGRRLGPTTVAEQLHPDAALPWQAYPRLRGPSP